MIVTGIEPVTKTRSKVYVDGQFAFVLYKGELSRYHVADGVELDQAIYDKIVKEVVLKRAKLRALHLLEDMDRTESGLRTKLRQGFYTEEIIDQALAYVKSFGYVDDSGYASRYIAGKSKTKSKREIYAGLMQKGIDKTQIDAAMEHFFSEHDEQEAIEALLRKKRFDPERADEKEKQRIYAYLMRKGFQYDDIRQVIQVCKPIA